MKELLRQRVHQGLGDGVRAVTSLHQAREHVCGGQLLLALMFYFILKAAALLAETPATASACG